VLQYGKWSPLHGAGVVLAAAELLRSEPFRFVLIGEGQLSAELRGSIAARGLTNVEWLGELPAGELRAHTLAADVCLGVFGGSEKAARVVPNKVFDALACGRPVVTADSDGAREWLRDGETALLTPAGDAAALAAALRRLLDARERARLGRGGLALYRRAFTPAAVAGELLAALDRS
jgi:glycosyltransferase involved in cell wall biosynthesis